MSAPQARAQLSRLRRVSQAVSGPLNAGVRHMSLVALSLSLVLTATEANTGIWAGPPPRTGWLATNQDGFCSLKWVEETDETKLEFVGTSATSDGSDVGIEFEAAWIELYERRGHE